MIRARTAALLLTLGPLVLGAAACSVGDAFQRPTTPAPAAWFNEPDRQSGERPSVEWWKEFKTPPLNGLMITALHDNFDVAAAIARVRQADAQLRIAGAPLLPTIDAKGSGTRSHTPVLRPTTTSKRFTVSNNFLAELNASYEIDFWGKNRAAADSAQASAESSRFDQQTVILTTQASLATTYFDYLGQQDRLVVAHENLAIAQRVLDAVSDRVKAGLLNDLDIAQQENQVAIVRASIPPIEQAISQDRNALAVLTGKAPEELELEGGSLMGAALPAITAGLPSELLTRRPDVQNAEAQLRAANADVTVARAAFFPSIDLTVQGGFESMSLATLLHGSSKLFSLAGSFTQPIFHGDALEGQLALRQARYDELVQDYRKAVISSFSDVENALVAVAKTEEERKAQETALATARRAAEIARDQMAGGIIDITTVLNVQRTLFQAQDALAQAKLAEIQAIVGLYKALGGGWQAPKVAGSS